MTEKSERQNHYSKKSEITPALMHIEKHLDNYKANLKNVLSKKNGVPVFSVALPNLE